MRRWCTWFVATKGRRLETTTKDRLRKEIMEVEESRGLVRGERSGPALVSGGSAGVEGSVVALLLCLGVGTYLLVRAYQRGNLISPPWNRERQRIVG